jgi:uncharacterized protein YbaR (Trm112 family)
MMTGAGGTGKSAVVHALRRQFKRLGLGRVLVTAYTGVAAAPFAGPTLLRLLNLNVKGKSALHVKTGDAEVQQRMLKKFQEECGAPIEEFGAVVIDEISFIDATVFGHVDRGFAILLGTTQMDDCICGGIPLLLCGDNHQKPPPGGTPCYQYLVQVAAQETEDPMARLSSFAKQRGFKLLTSARRIELKRLMRARDDQVFIDHQLQMRQTGLAYPISDQFLKQLHTVTDADLEADATWRFAPVGVLAHVERDFINLQRLLAFAKLFDLPIIRWRCEMVDYSAYEHGVRDEIYNHEPNLWSYFVEGVPVLLLDTISSVRMLVNGSPGLLDSLTITNPADLALVVRAYNTGYNNGAAVTLEETPIAVNVVVGGTERYPMLWHQVPLPINTILPYSTRNCTITPIR